MCKNIRYYIRLYTLIAFPRREVGLFIFCFPCTLTIYVRAYGGRTHNDGVNSFLVRQSIVSGEKRLDGALISCARTGVELCWFICVHRKIDKRAGGGTGVKSHCIGALILWLACVATGMELWFGGD